MELIYLDSNSTSRPADEVVRVMVEALGDDWGNPSSLHRFGQAARQHVDRARSSVARLLGASEDEIVFTSGGTEAANLAILGSLRTRPDRDVILTCRTEHGAVREVAELAADPHGSPLGRPVQVVWLDTDRDGQVDLERLAEQLRVLGERTALVSVMWVNNETGVIQPMDAIGELCRRHGVRLHTDATQAIGKLPCDVDALPVDLLGLSAHKLHGPKGAGALYVRRGVRLEPHQIGGPQELHRRGGTENVAGIAGLGVAAELAAAWLAGDGPRRALARRERFETRLLSSIEGAAVNGGGAPRTWSASNVALPVDAEPLLLLLSERGVYASAGAACSSGSLDPSPVLLAMGVEPELAMRSVRFSFSRETTDDETDRGAAIVIEAVERIRTFQSA